MGSGDVLFLREFFLSLLLRETRIEPSFRVLREAKILMHFQLFTHYTNSRLRGGGVSRLHHTLATMKLNDLLFLSAPRR